MRSDSSDDNPFRRKSEAERRAEIEDTLCPHQILVAGHEVSVESLSGRTSVGRLPRIAQNNGWDVKAGQSQSFSGDVLQQNWKVREGKVVDHLWFDARKDGARISASSLPHFTVGMRMVTADELKERIVE